MNKLTMDDCKPCPECGCIGVFFARLTQYRPKEAIGRCMECEYFLPIKGNHVHVLVREWNKNYDSIKN